MKCWNCGRNLDDLPSKIGFKTICDHCHAWLHCCRNCKNYMPGKPNDCLIPGTDPVSDRAAVNYCDEFVASGQPPKQGPSPEDIAKKLFKDE